MIIIDVGLAAANRPRIESLGKTVLCSRSRPGNRVRCLPSRASAPVIIRHLGALAALFDIVKMRTLATRRCTRMDMEHLMNLYDRRQHRSKTANPWPCRCRNDTRPFPGDSAGASLKLDGKEGGG